MSWPTATSYQDVAEVVTGAVTEILPGIEAAQVVGDRHLKELGADSVDRVEIITAVLDRLALDEPLSSFGDLPSVEAMVEFLYTRVSGSDQGGGQ